MELNTRDFKRRKRNLDLKRASSIYLTYEEIMGNEKKEEIAKKRKPVKRSKEQETSVAIRVSGSFKKQLQEKCLEHEDSPSWLVRGLLQGYMIESGSKLRDYMPEHTRVNEITRSMKSRNSTVTGKGKQQEITVRVSKEFKTELMTICRNKNINLSGLVRRYLEEYLNYYQGR